MVAVDTAAAPAPETTNERRSAPAADRIAALLPRIGAARADVAVGLLHLIGAVVVMSGQWRDTTHGYLIDSGQDQSMWEWFFAETAHSVAHLHNPLGTVLQNFPDGVNMMANTAMFGVGIPLTPVTLLFGPTVTFVLVLTLGLAGTGFAWYWLFSRELVTSRFAAALGGLFCGFAPAMVSHASAHPNFVVLALLPMLALLIIRMARRAVRGDENGTDDVEAGFRSTLPRIREAIVLGVLVALQIALGEEPLLIFALGFGLFALVYYLHAPRTGLRVARALIPTLALGAVITVALTTIPLWWQFFGPQSYRSIDHGPMGNDLAALPQFPSQSLGGLFSPGRNIAINPTEENAFFGWPLLVLVAGTSAWLWRRREPEHRLVRAVAAVIVAFTILSLGVSLRIERTDTGITLPWHWLDQVPLLNTVLETRFTLAAVPAIAVVLALATQRMLDYARASTADIRPVIWFVAMALALVPLVPTVLPVTHREPTPQFFTDGTVDRYVDDGSVVIAPPPTRLDAGPLKWQVDADFDFPLAGGYFVGPTADKKGRYGPDDRPTAALLMKAQRTDRIPEIDDRARTQAVADLAYWRADVVVLPPSDHGGAIRATLDQLLGFPGQVVDGVVVWDVRTLS
ncbi:glycosyl transferase [Nocardia sp. NPDC052254]|uniref:glycosyl transferase n=1 Tax=Nocardia sp. NPDC052254 TaxID=3155681 RepID=UPI00341C44DA